MRPRISRLCFLLTPFALCFAVAGCNNSNDTKEGAKFSGDKKPAKSTDTAKKAKLADEKAKPDGDDLQPAKKPGDGAKVVIEKEVPRGDGLLTPDPLDSEEPPTVPTVEMTEQHAATCLVKVGDTLPAGQLPDLSGKSQDVSKLFGDKLTVLVFFREGQDASAIELADLAVGVASPLAARGVNVIGVCERGSAESTAAACKKAGVSYPVLLDADGAYFARLATGKMPRTYLVDNTGKILWFDLDYNRGARHDLREALRALVAK